jgi:hypothetical protein
MIIKKQIYKPNQTNFLKGTAQNHGSGFVTLSKHTPKHCTKHGFGHVLEMLKTIPKHGTKHTLGGWV